MDKHITNEADLLKASMDGNSAAFESIVRKYQALICAITYSATRNVEKSEELAQETFVRAWENLKKLREPSRFKSWLCSIASNAIKEHFRSQKRDILHKADSLENTETEPFNTADPADNLISKEEQAVVALALGNIPESYRQPLVLFYRQEQSVSQVAQQLELSEENVRARLSRGRKMLKKQVVRMVENTLSNTAPGKTFTKLVMASVAGIVLKSASSASAAVNATGVSSTSTTTTGTSIATIMSGAAAKIVIAISVVAIVVSAVIMHKNIKPPQTSEENATQTKTEIQDEQPDATASVELVEEKDNNTISSSQLTSNADSLKDHADSENRLKSDSLDNEKVNVRIYSNWQTDPADYSMVKVGIKNRTVQFDSLKDKGDAVIVMLDEDQENPDIRRLLSRLIYASHAGSNLNDPNENFSRMYNRIPGPQDSTSQWEVIKNRRDRFEEWVFVDFDGNVIENATVAIFISSLNNGRKIKIGQYKAAASVKQYVTTGPMARLEFLVSHPDYGVAGVRAHTLLYSSKNTIKLPLVRKGSQADSLTACGYVVDPQGNPVVHAEVYSSTVKTVANSAITISSGPILTDKSGYFRYYGTPRIDAVYSRSGELIPQGSTYIMEITAKDERLIPFKGPVQNGKDELIALKYKSENGYNYYTFSFYYGDKKITDPNVLENITVSVTRHNKKTFKLKANQFSSGVVIPNGICKASYSKRHKAESCNYTISDKFAWLEVTEKSPQELVFRTEMQTCTGQILNAVTNEPMPGVFIVAANGTKDRHYSMFSDDIWETLQDMPQNPDDDDPGLCYLRRIFSLRKVARTDADGRFKMNYPCPKKTSKRLVYFARDFIGIQDDVFYHKPNDDGVVEMPTRKLYPAAKVSFLPKADAKKLVFMPEWLIDVQNNPDWVKEFLEPDGRKTWRFVYSKQLEYDTNDPYNDLPRSIYVPAGVSLKLRLNTVSLKKYDDHIFEKDILLSQGQTLDLGQFNFKKNIYVYVKVVNSENNPLEGYTVHQYMDKYKHPKPPSVSDKNGICELMVSPYSSGRFAVTMTLEETGDQIHEIVSVPFKINGYDDETVTYTLKLPEMK